MHCVYEEAISPDKNISIFTARKQSLRRLCFYTCLSVILFTGGCTGQVPPDRYTHPPRQVLHPVGRYTIPQVGTPPRQVHPLAGTPPGWIHPWAGTPQAGTPPLGRYTTQADTPLGRYTSLGRCSLWTSTRPPPPATVHAGIRSTGRRYVSHWNAFLFTTKFYANRFQTTVI